MRDPDIKFDLRIPDDLLDHGHVYKMLKEEVEEWLHFKLRWLNN